MSAGNHSLILISLGHITCHYLDSCYLAHYFCILLSHIVAKLLLRTSISFKPIGWSTISLPVRNRAWCISKHNNGVNLCIRPKNFVAFAASLQ